MLLTFTYQVWPSCIRTHGGTDEEKVEEYDIIDGDGLAGERVDPGDVYFNK